MNTEQLLALGVLTLPQGSPKTPVLTGHVYIRPGAPDEEKCTAVNLAAWLGFQAVGFDLGIIRAWQGETAPGFYVACGPEADCPGLTVRDGRITLADAGEGCGAVAAGLWGLEARADCPDAAAVAAAWDLSDLLEPGGGPVLDIDGDLTPEGLDVRLCISGCSDAEAALYGDVAARLAGCTCGLSLPMAVTGPPAGNRIDISLAGDSTVWLENAHGANVLHLEGEQAVRHFLTVYPWADGDRQIALTQVMELLDTRLRQAMAADRRAGSGKASPEPLTLAADFPWEVDTLHQTLEAELYPALTPGEPAELLIAVSEEAEVRAAVKAHIEARLAALGVPGRVTVISAFKQGQSFVEEAVVPLIVQADPPVTELVIGFRPFVKNPGEPWDETPGAMPSYADERGADKWFDLPIRWLQELYPIDDIIAQRTGLSPDAIRFEALPEDSPYTYRVMASGPRGTVADETFTARYYERPYLHDFPGEGLVHPHQGFARCRQAGGLTWEKALPTDLDMLWDWYQATALPALRRHIEASGPPSTACQPFFGALTLELWASEPDSPLGIRQDTLSSLDFLHEDIYFTALDYFRVWGKELGDSFQAPGLILPLVHKRAGQGVSVRMTVTPGEGDSAEDAQGFKLTGYKTDGFCINELTIDYAELTVQAQRISTIVQREGLAVPGFGGKVTLRTSDGRVASFTADRQPVLAGPDLTDRQALDLIEGTVLTHEHYLGLTRWLAGKGAPVCLAGVSSQGRPIYAFQLTGGPATAVVSRQKLMAQKPTALFINRHHANEVSSSNAAFGLIHQLLCLPERRKLLENINVVILPLENVDGGAINDRLAQLNSTWIHHTARFNSAGYEFYYDYFRPSRYSESRAFPAIWHRWLPDFVTDNHGVPSHEWAQPFSGYVSPWFKGFWLPRGLFYGICTYADHPDYPGAKALCDAIVARSAAALNSDGEIRALNAELKERHSKYANSWMPNMYPQNDTEGLVYYRTPAAPSPEARYPNLRHPHITAMSWITEVSDETAQGDYLKLCIRAHALADQAALELLRDQPVCIDEGVEPLVGRPTLIKKRRRPIGQ